MRCLLPRTLQREGEVLLDLIKDLSLEWEGDMMIKVRRRMRDSSMIKQMQRKDRLMTMSIHFLTKHSVF